MVYNPEKHKRKSTRLKGYDYSSSGGYFVTICVKDRQCLFGEIIDSEMNLSETGKIIKSEWINTQNIRPNIIIDEFVIMPNHFHGIIFIQNINDDIGRLQNAPASVNESKQLKNGEYYSNLSQKNSLGSIIRGFKSSTTSKIKKLMQGRFANSQYQLWQRNYHEWIIRDEKHLERFRDYIWQNPLKWEIDSENPDKKQ